MTEPPYQKNLQGYKVGGNPFLKPHIVNTVGQGKGYNETGCRSYGPNHYIIGVSISPLFLLAYLI